MAHPTHCNAAIPSVAWTSTCQTEESVPQPELYQRTSTPNSTVPVSVREHTPFTSLSCSRNVTLRYALFRNGITERHYQKLTIIIISARERRHLTYSRFYYYYYYYYCAIISLFLQNCTRKHTKNYMYYYFLYNYNYYEAYTAKIMWIISESFALIDKNEPRHRAFEYVWILPKKAGENRAWTLSSHYSDSLNTKKLYAILTIIASEIKQS